jgi:hypothetical protein
MTDELDRLLADKPALREVATQPTERGGLCEQLRDELRTLVDQVRGEAAAIALDALHGELVRMATEVDEARRVLEKRQARETGDRTC